VVVLTSVPLVPVTVRLNVVFDAPDLAVTLSVVVPDPVTEVGLNVAVKFAPGNPLAVKLVVPTKPPVPVSVIVDVPAAPPLVMFRLVGDAEREKLPGELITSETGDVRVRLPLTPFTVSGYVEG
jgi:hypothetical protein